MEHDAEYDPHDGAPLVEVDRTDDGRRAREHALVLQAVGIAHARRREGRAHALFVTHGDAARARDQLQRYDAENVNWPPRGEQIVLVTNGFGGAAVYALVLVLFLVLEQHVAFGHDWWTRGLSQAGLFRGGEWWRPITSLTLHSGWPHLVSNVVFGALFGAIVAQLVGSGVAWLTILLAGILGNATNALLHPATHSSIGASTAVFGALGVLVGYEWKRRLRLQMGPVKRWGLVVMGLALLGMFGVTDDPGTDVMAHVFGFLAGCGLGVPLGVAHERWRLAARSVQVVSSAMIVAVLAIAWTAALSG